jgi:serine/threonine protein kinase
MLAYTRGGGSTDEEPATAIPGFDPDVCIKLGDFGLAKELEGTLTSLVLSSVGTGTLLTMAPEAMGGNYGAHGDVFAWGVTMCMVASQALPDPPVPMGAHRDAIAEAGLLLLRARSEDVGDVVERSMKLNHNKRPCSTEVRDRLMVAAGLWPALGV